MNSASQNHTAGIPTTAELVCTLLSVGADSMSIQEIASIQAFLTDLARVRQEVPARGSAGQLDENMRRLIGSFLEARADDAEGSETLTAEQVLSLMAEAHETESYDGTKIMEALAALSFEDEGGEVPADRKLRTTRLEDSPSVRQSLSALNFGDFDEEAAWVDWQDGIEERRAIRMARRKKARSSLQDVFGWLDGNGDNTAEQDQSKLVYEFLADLLGDDFENQPPKGDKGEPTPAQAVEPEEPSGKSFLERLLEDKANEADEQDLSVEDFIAELMRGDAEEASDSPCDCKVCQPTPNTLTQQAIEEARLLSESREAVAGSSLMMLMVEAVFGGQPNQPEQAAREKALLSSIAGKLACHIGQPWATVWDEAVLISRFLRFNSHIRAARIIDTMLDLRFAFSIDPAKGE